MDTSKKNQRIIREEQKIRISFRTYDSHYDSRLSEKHGLHMDDLYSQMMGIIITMTDVNIRVILSLNL